MTAAVSTYLGYGPILQPMLLITGKTFVQNIEPSQGGVFPTGTTVTLDLSTAMGAAITSWAATVTAELASWTVSNTLADAIPANSRYEVTVTYPTSPVTIYCWFAGPVVRNPI
ncbi:hypothetical protein ACIP5Y_21445 [Nocardia sp. NPDC088792]|uniref:LtfC-like domain-containing protein n=1 Tax=Nocardia sp. NPDC088792 TaxID=3364332 RepID=UPI003806BF68